MNVLMTIDRWDFDIFALHKLSEGNALMSVGCYIFQRTGMIKVGRPLFLSYGAR